MIRHRVQNLLILLSVKIYISPFQYYQIVSFLSLYLFCSRFDV
jgi:hypothetical protein